MILMEKVISANIGLSWYVFDLMFLMIIVVFYKILSRLFYPFIGKWDLVLCSGDMPLCELFCTLNNFFSKNFPIF